MQINEKIKITKLIYTIPDTNKQRRTPVNWIGTVKKIENSTITISCEHKGNAFTLWINTLESRIEYKSLGFDNNTTTIKTVKQSNKATVKILRRYFEYWQLSKKSQEKALQELPIEAWTDTSSYCEKENIKFYLDGELYI